MILVQDIFNQYSLLCRETMAFSIVLNSINNDSYTSAKKVFSNHDDINNDNYDFVNYTALKGDTSTPRFFWGE